MCSDNMPCRFHRCGFASAPGNLLWACTTSTAAACLYTSHTTYIYIIMLCSLLASFYLHFNPIFVVALMCQI